VKISVIDFWILSNVFEIHRSTIDSKRDLVASSESARKIEIMAQKGRFYNLLACEKVTTMKKMEGSFIVPSSSTIGPFSAGLTQPYLHFIHLEQIKRQHFQK
jgi:hypothetical protein